MEIKKFDISMVSEVVKLWNENVVPYEIYAEFTDELFVGEILKNPCFNEEGCVVAVEGMKSLVLLLVLLERMRKEKQLTLVLFICYLLNAVIKEKELELNF